MSRGADSRQTALYDRHALSADIKHALAFSLPASRLGTDWGYLLGFGLYVIWCRSAPLAVLDPGGIASMFKKEHSLSGRENWLITAPSVLAARWSPGIYNIPNPGLVSTPILLFAPVAIVNGPCEENLWRGTYPRALPRSLWLACV